MFASLKYIEILYILRSEAKSAQVLSPTAFGEQCKQRKSARTPFSNSRGSKLMF